ncbi:glycosyl hydrolase [Rhypophila decipiens]|uniref:Glycosyl hydrolase n=1 Tax=Rhypophila decipiens TaxID=261697 RepID=A0AAN6YKI4_9PEZI|nr:glycosyl hydrolase [Rhypophila decipiens]
MASMFIITIITLLYAQLAVGDRPSPIIDSLQTYPHGNPFMPSVYGFTDAAVYDKNYWVYSSGVPQGQNSSQIVAYSSADLKTWGTPVPVLKINKTSFSWAAGPIYAAATVRQGAYYSDKYFLYFLTPAIGGTTLNIGVRVAGQPNGTYTDARGSALLDTTSPKVNDETGALAVFTENGQTSLYFYGSGRLKSVKLNNDMISPNGSPEDLDIRITANGDSNAFDNTHSDLAGLKIVKRGNSYYLIFKYSKELITQAKSEALNGSFVISKTILVPGGRIATSIGQATVINNEDNYFLVYSRGGFATSGLAYDQMTFNIADNLIEAVKMLVHDKLIWSENGKAIYSQCPPPEPSCRQTLRAGDSTSWMQNNFTDLDYAITVVGSQSMGADPSAGVVFRARYAQLNNNPYVSIEGYYAGITFDNKILLGKMGQTFTFLKSADLPKHTVFMSEHKLRVIAKGQNISVHVNNAALISDVIDATYPWGMTGTRVYNAGAKFSELWIKPASG